jgi:hypothetical protein
MKISKIVYLFNIFQLLICVVEGIFLKYIGVNDG